MQKHLDDLARQAGLAPEWKALSRDLDRLQQVRIHYRAADWLCAHRRRARCDQAFQMRPCRLAVPRPPSPSPAAGPVQIRTKTPRPPQA